MRRTNRSEISSVMLASFQLFAKGKNVLWNTRPFIARHRSMGSPFLTEKAGPKAGPTILLLHGLPSSSRMFEPLFARLSDRFHLVRPITLAFGHSDWPDPKNSRIRRSHRGNHDHFTETLGSRVLLFTCRITADRLVSHGTAHPERVEALIVQDAVAHTRAGANWKPRPSLGRSRLRTNALRTNLLSLQTTRTPMWERI